jgi:BASS family bile acid:Na+ symporter
MTILILRIVAPMSVALVVFSQGLGVSLSQVTAYWQERPGVMVRALVAALVIVPAAALAAIFLLKPSAGVAIGVAILVSCPPAPLMVSSAPRKGGASAPFMVCLHLSLAALALLTVPIALYLLSIAFDFNGEVNLGAMAWILAKTILLPVGFGLAVRAVAPAFADRAAPVLAKAGLIGVLIVVLIVLAGAYRSLLNMDWWSYLVIAIVSVTSLAIGHLLGPRDAAEKTALAIECGVRHPALALTIGAANFGAQRALPVLIPCVLTFIAIALVYMALRARSMATAKHKAH